MEAPSLLQQEISRNIFRKTLWPCHAVFHFKIFVSLCIYEKELKSWVYNLEIKRFDFKKLNLISTITDLASIVDESQHFLQVFRDRIIVTVAKNDPSARKTPIQVCCLSVLKLYLLSNWSFVVTAIFHFDLLIRLKMNKKKPLQKICYF